MKTHSLQRTLRQKVPVSLWLVCALSLLVTSSARAAVSLSSPGFKASTIDDRGRFVEDWGTFDFQVNVAGQSETERKVSDLKLDDVTPAAAVTSQCGPVALTQTIFRAPAWPAGLDVLTLRLEETAGATQSVHLSLALPDTVRFGARTVSVADRIVVTLPDGSRAEQAMREWGWDDDARALGDWAKPKGQCDAGFRSIRAGMGGVPIHYTFKVEPKAASTVVLGFCESHWAEPAHRPMVCQVEGAKPQEVDPVANWGQHQAGGLLFQGRDQNGDGKLDVFVMPSPAASDQNPILNVLWLFPPSDKLNVDQVVAGRLNGLAVRYVDVGGKEDQSLYAGGKVEYQVSLGPKAAQELTFLVACADGNAPIPDKTAWTLPKLRQAAAEVQRGWTGR